MRGRGRRDKTGGVTRHVNMPLELDARLEQYAAINRRAVTEQIVAIVDEHLNGPLVLRLLVLPGTAGGP